MRSMVGLLLVMVCLPARAEFVIKQVQANLVERELHVSADVELSLSEQAVLAVDNGVPVVVLTEFELIQTGTLWNETLARRDNGARLRYHSLSNQYIVEGLEVGDIETYRSVADALKRMGTLRSIVVDIPGSAPLEPSRLKLVVRTRLDINALPPPLRPLALFSADWRLSSDWSTWQISP